MKVLAVLDATLGSAPAQAGALTAFLAERLHTSAPKDPGAGPAGHRQQILGETVVFYADEAGRDAAVETAPTRDVRTVEVPAWRADLMAASLAELSRTGDVDLLLFAGDATGDELATRVACRAAGQLLTGVIDITAEDDGARCRTNVYSGHMVGEFLATGRPLCVGLEPGLGLRFRERGGAVEPAAEVGRKERCGSAEAARPDATRPSEHVVLSDTPLVENATMGPPPFADVEPTDPPPRGDLIEAPFLVVAGNGLGGREPVDRLAAAARRMGAAFGVTRPVAMNGWAPLDRLLGVSGARTAPDICVVAGASGAPAFTWGIEQARVIVAINPDEHAPIARTADYVVLDDGLAVVEGLAERAATPPEGEDQASS